LWVAFHQPLLGTPGLDNGFYLVSALALGVWISVHLFASARSGRAGARPPAHRPAIPFARSSTPQP
jgi:hypothetical protein